LIPLQGCYNAFSGLYVNKTNAISCTPGIEAIGSKSKLVITLVKAYGHGGAHAITPTAFALPSQHEQFISYLKQTEYAGTWALKKLTHRGKGVIAVSGAKAAQLTTPAPEKTGSNTVPYAVAQRFIDNQHFPMPNRPFSMRVWTVIAGGGGPSGVFRTFLYDGGTLVLGDPINNDNEEQRAQSMIVNINLLDREKIVEHWTLSTLRQHLQNTTGSGAAFDRLWRYVQRATAAAMAAAVPDIVKATSALKGYQGGNVELLGFDFVVDKTLRPWIVEINTIPSMSRKIVNCYAPGEEIKPGAVPCIENARDEERQKLLTAHLLTIASRLKGMAARRAAVELAMASQPECSTVDKELLVRLLEADDSRRDAVSRGFVDVTPLFYASLKCMSGDEKACAVSLPTAVEEEKSALASIVSKAGRWVRTKLSEIISLRSPPFSGNQGLMQSWPEDASPYAAGAPFYKPRLSDDVMQAWLARQSLQSDEPAEYSTILQTLCRVAGKQGTRKATLHTEL
jgi:hypothetical protein